MIKDIKEVAAGMQKMKRLGFAAMDPDLQRDIAALGGQAAHAKGRAHEFTSEEAREAGRKGGLAVSRNRGYMRFIGGKGGLAVSADRAHMVEIGRRGGAAVVAKRAAK